MDVQLRPPKFVQTAAESQRGLHWALELLIFAAVFVVCTVGESLALIPVQMGILMRDQNYLQAVKSNDLNSIAEASLEALNTDLYVISSLFVTAIMIVIVLLFCRLIQKRSFHTLGFVKQGAAKEYLKGILVGFVLFSAAVLICVLTGALKLSGIKEAFRLPVFLLFAAGYMIQGMAEEVLCRGYFMVSLGRRYLMAVAIFLNSAAFAALHLFNPGIAPLAIINLTLFGVFASICFIKTENIWMVGAIHSVWNLAQGNIYGIKVSGMETSCSLFASTAAEGRELFHGGAFGLEGGLAVTIVLTAAPLILLFWKRPEHSHDMEEL